MLSDKALHLPELYRIPREDIVVLIDSEAPNWSAVNREGVRVLEQCDGKRSAEEIAISLANSFSKEDVHRFIKEALKCGIISITPVTRTAYQGRSAYLKETALEELWVYLTKDCNLRCTHCLVRGGEDLGPELRTDEVKQITREAARLGVGRIFFTGGEPFMRSDIFDLIDYVTRDLKLELVILTNGTLLDNGMIDRLKDRPNILIQVSLEGPNPRVNDSIRGRGSFKKTLRNVDALLGVGVRTTVTSTVTKANLDYIPELNETLSEKQAQSHHILWVHKRGRAVENQVSVESQEILHLMHRLKEGQTKVDNWENIKSRVRSGRGVKIDGCHAGHTSLCIDSNGDVYPCPSLNGEKRFRMGSAMDGLEKIRKRPVSGDDLRGVSVIDIPGCSNCEFRFFCGGGCRCQAFYGDKEPNLFAKDPYCEVTKGMLMESILSLISPNGTGRPEILGHMRESGSGCGPSGVAQGRVDLFHCSCVLGEGYGKRGKTMERYRQAALNPSPDLCCPTGYSQIDIEHIPADTINISYGCGNPTAFSSLREGETVLDLGSGGGIDCFIAAQKVGRGGRVIGVDMTDEMLMLAEENRVKMAEVLGYDVVEFRKGFLEDLPVEDRSIDLVISNCVINLSPDKHRVFNEIFRVLKPGGRFSISDIVSDRPVPERMKEDAELWSGCISGAMTEGGFLEGLKDAGLREVTVENSHCWKEVGGIVFSSITVVGRKP